MLNDFTTEKHHPLEILLYIPFLCAFSIIVLVCAAVLTHSRLSDVTIFFNY